MKRIGIFLVCIILVTFVFVIISNNNVKAADAYAIFYPTDDTVVSEEFNDTNHGDGPTLRFRTYSGIQRYNFIKFGTSTIQPGTIIKSAMLKFYWYAQPDGNASGYNASAYRVTEDWDEDNVTWNNFSVHISATMYEGQGVVPAIFSPVPQDLV